MILRVAGIFLSLIIIPLTINYVDPVRYGIWMTISSIVVWISYFDLGLANGFRNRFTESLAKNDTHLARQYVSTTYFLISAMMLGAIIIFSIINYFLNWSTILGVSQQYNSELHKVFFTLCCVLGFSLIVNVFSKLILADQRPAINSLIVFIGQLFSLLSIVILKRFTQGSLFYLALFFSSMPPLVVFLCSVFSFFFTKYKHYRPSIAHINLKLSKNILGIGIKFFLIQIFLLAIIQLINIVLSRTISPLSVTQYTVSYKYFSVLLMVATICISPFWSAFTDAYSKNDYNWMRHTLKHIDKFVGIFILIIAIMTLISPFVYKIWLHGEVSIAFYISISVAVFAFFQSAGYVYMTLINGIGKVWIQVCIFSFFAIIAYPSMTFLCRHFGIPGVTIIPTLAYLCQMLFLRIQLSKLINKTAVGVWNK